MAPVKSAQPPPASDEEKRQLRHWIERWETVGPLLDDERWARLAAASETDLRLQAFDLLACCVPGRAGDDGEGLVRQQAVLARLLAGGDK
jgi:hypothetical protein